MPVMLSQWKQGYAVLDVDRETSHQIKQDE